VGIYFGDDLKRQDFLDYAHAFINIYESVWRGRSNATEWRQQCTGDTIDHRFWFFELTSYSCNDIDTEQYVARLIQFPKRDGFRVLIHEYPSALPPIEGVQREPSTEVVLLEDRFYPPSELGSLGDWDSPEEDDSNFDDSDAGSVPSTSEDLLQEEEDV
jgi:hypothetical protein